MTARRLALAWCWGSVCGLVVGWVYGSAVRDLAAFRALRRAEPGPGAPQPHSETPEVGNGAQAGAQRCGLLDPIGRNRCSLSRGHKGLHRNPEAYDVPWPTQPGWVDLFGIDPDYTDGVPVGEFIERNRAEHAIPAQRDDEPCPQYSPGGGLPCSVTGVHTAHIFLGSCAPDAKDDADERIE